MMSGRFDTKLSGVIPPMITPLTADGAVDTDAIGRLAEHMLSGGVSGIFVLGSSGEGPWLTDRDRRTVIETTVRAVNGRVPVLAGVLDPGTARTAAAIEQAAAANADYVVVTTPYYFGTDEQTLTRHIETIAKHSPLPVMLYNIPSMTHNVLPPPVVEQVLDHPQIVGIKDSAGDRDAFARLLALREKRADFVVFQGAEVLCYEAMAQKADGVVPGMGNLVPHLFAAVVGHVQTGKEDAASGIQAELNKLWHLHTHGYWLVCLKYAASLLGFGSGETAGHGRLTDRAAQTEIQRLLRVASEVTV